MKTRFLILAVGSVLLSACRTAPLGAPPNLEGVYDLRLFRESGVSNGTLSLEWTPDGYEGYVASANRHLPLIEADVDSQRARLRFEANGVRFFLTLGVAGDPLKGGWQEMGRGGAVEARRRGPS